MKDEAKNWFLHAEEHFSDMEFLYDNSKYSMALYCAHQTMEMILKAAIVQFASVVPPKSHNLDLLMRATKLTPPDKWYEQLAEATKHYERVKYPDYQRYAYTSRDKVEPTIKLTREVYLWVKNKLTVS